MPELIYCPSCQRRLTVPDDLLGQDVQCPTCSAMFVASIGGPGPAVIQQERSPHGDYPPSRHSQRRDLMPHRGTLILVLGILSIVLGVMLYGVLGVILGPIAWIMGSNDLKEIRAGRMDPDGEGTTNAGRICGIVGLSLGILYGLGCIALIGLIVATAN